MENAILSCVLLSTLNYALYANRVPVIRALTIRNDSEETLRDLELRVTSDPVFSVPASYHIDSVAPHAVYDAQGFALSPLPEFLFSLTERTEATLHFSLVDAEEQTLATLDRPITLLARDEWSGSAATPEMLAAFVTPNHPAVAELVRSASALLASWTGSSAFTGYQSGSPAAARTQVAAIFSAIRAQRIAYCAPPASFEDSGQRIRLCDTILSSRFATCLDFTLLAASCLEFAGLRPLIVVFRGHACLGAWLDEESFSEAVQDDETLLTKRIAEGMAELCVVEATHMADGMKGTFEDACKDAERRLAGNGDFLFFVDVFRARVGGIRPIPLRVEEAASPTVTGMSAFDTPPKPVASYDTAEPSASGGLTRLQLWERKLLDLSLRNSLLNFRSTKTSLPLTVHGLHKLEDALADGTEFSLLPRPDDIEAMEIDAPLAPEHIALLDAEFASKRLRSALSEGETRDRVVSLYRAARTSLEENGANTLYFALGFLRWYESDAPASPARRAPILLIPAEIVRKSAGKSGFCVRIRDDEPAVNITLLELLRADYDIRVDGLDPVPMDDNGVDLSKIFTLLRRAIINQKRWDVEESAYLGVFSFSQFIMWNDLRHRAGELRENLVARSLESGRLEWNPDTYFENPRTLDDTVAPSDLAVVMSADSSQLAAVMAAGQGQSFVLHGPPGTGKSQTITNMIANALYQGKTILFIAEKQAALSVVQRRLASVGLDPFCLELHSNKAKKRDVLNKLDAALSVGRIQPPETYAAAADRLRAQRDSLNAVVHALHKVYPCGLSLYDAIAALEQYRDYPDLIKFPDGTLSELSAERYSHWRELASQCDAVGSMLGSIHKHPLSEFTRVTYTQKLRADLAELLTGYAEVLNSFSSRALALTASLGLVETSVDQFSFEQLSALVNLARALSSIDVMPAGLVLNRDLSLLRQRFVAVCVSGRRRDTLRHSILTHFYDTALMFDAISTQRDLREAESGWFLKKALGRAKVLKSLKRIARDPVSLDISPAAVDIALRDIAEYHDRTAEVGVTASIFEPIFGLLWNNGSPNWDSLERAFEQASVLSTALQILCPDAARRASALDAMERDVFANADAFRIRFGAALEAFAANFDRISVYAQRMTVLCGVDPNPLHIRTPWVSATLDAVNRWAGALEHLRDWSAWLVLRTSLCTDGLSSLAEALEDGRLAPSDTLPALSRSVASGLAFEIAAREHALDGFNGPLFEQKLARYRETAAEFEQLTRHELIAALSSRIPAAGADAASSSEIAILRRAIKSGGRALSIRRLFSQIPNLLPRLAPCMLMSPISAAQYIDPSFPKFDLVIFDEASQMPTCEAVGAIARGRSLVVVGDPRQLPPTSFFNTNRIDEDNIDHEDLESVLDDCMALDMPQTALRWHYRSRHESLISFSNRRFYDNRLYTFPSPNDLESRVTHIPVEGFYDRAKTKQNRAEAEAVVQEIVRRMRDPQQKALSMGVVTFSLVQQNLIEDLLSAEFALDPALDEQNSASHEPVFIKNLENVQGDERDIILFSVGYGPDERGTVTYNFGPLNRDGGWRRLNVAVSRARCEMLVFSVLRPEQIDLSRVRSDGVLALRAFLEFAMRGSAALSVRREEPDPLVASIADSLGSLGYETRTNIGASAFKIDVGIVHPEHPDTYVLGILVDNARRDGACTARDRDIVQTGVLGSLGWRIHHVWALDWWENPEKELMRIRATVREILSETATETPGRLAPSSLDSADKQPKIASIADLPRVAPAPRIEKKPDIYRIASLDRVTAGFGDSQEFAQPRRARTIKAQINRVLAAEAPIERDALRRRVLDAWGISRAGARIDRRFDELLAELDIPVTHADDRVFYWLPTQDSTVYKTFRVPSGPDAARRAMEDIPPQELAAAAHDILSRQLGMDMSDLERTVAALFGYTRLTSAIVPFVRSGIQAAIGRGYIVVDGDRVSVGRET
ncbi:MAG: DUF3320 domain-containing protein [Clostridiaceae bacterium]|nr:DUF3320 domain-containing protein [Clostridiaceae bacterium]